MLPCSLFFSFQGMPKQWSKLLKKSAIAREDDAQDPQAVLGVLEFYANDQKREIEEMAAMAHGLSGSILGLLIPLMPTYLQLLRGQASLLGCQRRRKDPWQWRWPKKKITQWISTMMEEQIMEKLRLLVSDEDPKFTL
jgi:hypothetical protein